MSQTVQDILNKLVSKIIPVYAFHLERPGNDAATAEQRTYSGGAAKMLKDVILLIELGKKQDQEGKTITFEQEQQVAADANTNLTVSINGDVNQ